MTSATRSSQGSSPGRAGRRRPVLRALLALAILIPTGVLFAQVWRDKSDKIAFGDTERVGIEYLGSLSQVATALTDNASAVVAGRTVDTGALEDAVSTMAAVDNRVGDRLRTSERWAGLRAKIESLPRTAEPADAMSAYSEATDLLEALFEEVRDESGMIRDPDADTYFLQDGVTQELPEAVVTANHLADVLTTAVRLNPAQRAAQAGDETVARAAALSPAGDLVDDVRDAVDASRSRTLGEALLSRLDRFRRAIDTLTGMTSVGPAGAALTAEQIAGVRIEAQAAAAELAETVLAELDGLIKIRLDRLGRDRLLAVAAMAIALAFALAPTALTAVRTVRRRRRARALWNAPPGGPRTGPPPDRGGPPSGPHDYGGDDRLEREWARATR